MTYIFVEGDDDRRFIEGILICYFDDPTIIEYSAKNKILIDSYFKTLTPDKYYVFADLDYKNDDQDVIDHLKKKYPHVSDERIFIVKMEIESWYIAGVNEKKRVEFKYGKIPEHTDNLCKEKVYSIIKNKKNRENLTELIRIVNNYDINIAKIRNDSFRKFISLMDQN